VIGSNGGAGGLKAAAALGLALLLGTSQGALAKVQQARDPMAP
jgi:hypothetical protein